jgi:hypothetical protein
MDNPYEVIYTVTRKAQGEHCTIQRAAQRINKPMDTIINEIRRIGKYEDATWLIVVAR